jgi:hypothetical protein
MAEHYYIVSSLPFLLFREEPPLTYREFLEVCHMWLGEQDFVQLQRARLDVESVAMEDVRNETLKRWLLFENSLRNELVKFRAQGLRIKPEAHLRTDLPWDPSVVSHTREALEEGDPLEVEVALSRMRWQFLSDQEVGHYFDLDALIIYALKIQIMERLTKLDAEHGREILRRIIEENLRDAG